MPGARLLSCLAAALAAPVAAQERPARGDDIIVVAPDRGGDCIAPKKDGARWLMLDCLTRSLDGDGAPVARPPVDTAAAGGRAPPSRTGTFSRSATAQRMGNNFGRSARPQRPAPPVYAPPLRGPR